MRKTLFIATMLAMASTFLSAQNFPSSRHNTLAQNMMNQNANQRSSYSTSMQQTGKDQYQTTDDQKLLQAIKDQLRNSNFDSRNNDLQFSISDGNVVVKGSVPSERAKQNLKQLLANIPGVRNVIAKLYIEEWDAGRGDQQRNRSMSRSDSNSIRNYRYQQNRMNDSSNASRTTMQQYRNRNMISDSDLKQQVQDSLNGNGWFSKNFNNVMIEVDEGTVTLSGYVDNPKDKMDAENKVKNIQGVTEVINMIEVGNPGQSPNTSSNRNRSW